MRSLRAECECTPCSAAFFAVLALVSGFEAIPSLVSFDLLGNTDDKRAYSSQ